MMRLALLVAIPIWSAVTLGAARAGGRRLPWVLTIAAALFLASWAGARVGTANPVSRTGRFDPLLVLVLGALMLAITGGGVTWGVVAAMDGGRPQWQVVGLGTLTGLAAIPVALLAALVVDVLWPH